MAKQHFSPKDRIDHHVYGPGTIIEVNERHLSIAFDTAGKRKFLTSKVQLVRSDVPAPAKPTPVRKKKVAKAG